MAGITQKSCVAFFSFHCDASKNYIKLFSFKQLAMVYLT